MRSNRFSLLEKLLSVFSQKPSKIRRIPRKILSVQGEHYNLQDIFNEINAKYFQGSLKIAITWSGSKKSRPRRSILFGSYHLKQEVIRIHRRLDGPDVPLYFIQFVVYHEALHHVFPPIREKRKRRIHHAEFKKKEKEFADYLLAKAYGKAYNFKS